MLHNYSKNNHLKGVLTIFLVTIIWGSGFVAADIAMDEVDMYFVLAARFVIGTFTLLLFALPTIKNVRKSALKSGSIIISDNIYARGITFGDNVSKRNMTIKRNMNRFIEEIFKEEYESYIVPIGDGLAVSRVK